MTTFLVIAVFMAAIAATAVAWPLLRSRESRLAGAAAAVLVMAAAAGLYPLWSNWNWHEAPAAAAGRESPSARHGRRARATRCRRRRTTSRAGCSSGAPISRSSASTTPSPPIEHAHRLDADNVEALLGLGEALSMRAGGNITPAAGRAVRARGEP